uniref:Uncharacterized protein n=1 Tax=Octopus bimaculoides TaxID=37653 RepID=A0A0L8HVL0_OCTBM
MHTLVLMHILVHSNTHMSSFFFSFFSLKLTNKHLQNFLIKQASRRHNKSSTFKLMDLKGTPFNI